MYPDSNIWIIGHSLGGALAGLLGVTYGAPVIAFEAPGERMAASRLHLPSPVSPLFVLVLHLSYVKNSLILNISNMSIIRLTRLQWELVPESYPRALSVGMPWNRGELSITSDKGTCHLSSVDVI